MNGPFPPIVANGIRRRSTRLLESIPLVIAAQDAAGRNFREETATLSINCHGCRYFSQYEMRKNAKITVNLSAARTSASLNHAVSAHIAWIQKSHRLTGLFQVAAEFETPNNIWSVRNFPEDWARFTTTPLQQANAELAEIERLLQLANTGTYYQLLDVANDAPPAVLKHQFYQLARRFHPDHHMEHPEWTPRLLMLMDSLTTAYKTLSSDGSKKDYDAHLLQSGAFELRHEKSQAQILADECLQKARHCLAAKNYVGSIVWLRRAIEAEPHSSRYRTMLARSLAAVPEYRREAIEQFEKAIELDPFNIPAHMQLGKILETMSLPWRAKPLYARVLQLDGDYPEAHERIRSIDAGAASASSRPSLLGRLTRRRP